MTAKHSGGNWYVSYPAIVVERTRTIGGNREHFEVAEVTGPDIPECRANARLIAAAPDLLEAARAVLEGANAVNAVPEAAILALAAAVQKAEASKR